MFNFLKRKKTKVDGAESVISPVGFSSMNIPLAEEGSHYLDKSHLRDLVNYILQARKVGVSDKNITADLKQAGWAEGDIQTALEQSLE
jgi:isopentenyl diphosphate isomerase/L-lactate dehydrogenase-like FMN-dependent dehydrogenase